MLTKATADSFFLWVNRASVGIILYLATEMRADIKNLNASVPVIQQQIIDIKNEQDRMKDKIYAALFKTGAAKKEDFLNIVELLKIR